MLTPEAVIANVFAAIDPIFNSYAMLKVIFPLSLILGTVHMLVDAHASRFVIEPEALVDVSVGVEKLAPTVGLVVLPVA